MYRLKLEPDEYERFKRLVKSEMILQNKTISQIAIETKYSEKTIRHFLSYQNSKFVARALADTLGIEVEDET